MRGVDLRQPFPTRIGLGALGAGTFLVAFSNHGEVFGVPSESLQWPSLPGTLGTFLVGLGLALLLMLGLSGNLAMPFRRSLWIAAGLVVASILVGFVPGYARFDEDFVLSRFLVAASLAAALWPDRRARIAGLAAASMLAALALAFHFEPHVYATGPDGTMQPIGEGARWLVPVSRALFPFTGMVAGLALLFGVPAVTRPTSTPAR